ncbi:MAG: MFS transporter [Nitrososphaerota archaeon]|nr:MFS transporter [Nitrososphaerota archaeon]
MSEPRKNTQYMNFAVSWTTQTTTAMLIFAVPALAPLLVSHLALTRAEIGGLVGITYIGVSTTSMLFGIVADNIGIRKVLFIGHLAEAVSIVGASISHNFISLAVSMLGVGMGYSAITPVTSKAIHDWFPSRNRGSVMGLKQTGTTVGGALAGFILPLLGVHFGVQISFVAAGILVMLGSTFLLGYTELGYRRPTSFRFLRQGLATSFRNRNLVSTGLVGFCFAAVQAAVVTYIALFVQNSIGFGAVVSGLFLSLANISGTVGRPVFGLVSDRVLHGNRVKDLLIIALTSGLMLLLISIFPEHGNILFLVAIVAVLGFSALGWNGVFLTLSGEYSPRGYEGVGTSLAFSLAMLGQVMGAPVFGLLVDFTGNYNFGWRVFAVLLVLASILYVFTRHDK